MKGMGKNYVVPESTYPSETFLPEGEEYHF
jgi:hypothetical protein